MDTIVEVPVVVNPYVPPGELFILPRLEQYFHRFYPAIPPMPPLMLTMLDEPEYPIMLNAIEWLDQDGGA